MSGAGLNHEVCASSSPRKIMHATACYMPCMHHVSASLMPPTPVRVKACIAQVSGT
jgi:hypothetical protein